MRIAHLAAVACLIASPVAAATIENFDVRTAADLVALCDARPDSDKYVAAIHFCQGFGVGAWQYYRAQSADDPTSQFVCIPNPPPTRNQAMNGFVAWTKDHPQHWDEAPVDALFRYLAETYPCGR